MSQPTDPATAPATAAATSAATQAASPPTPTPVPLPNGRRRRPAPVPVAAQPGAKTMPGRPSGRMTLDNVISGRVAEPMRVLIFGVEGVGKSTAAAGAPDAIFLDADRGTSRLNVRRFPRPDTWLDVMEAIGELTTAQHPYKTLVIDTLDALESLCWRHVCAAKRVASIEDFGYGKGYSAALDTWRTLADALERLRAARAMHVVLVAHSWIKSFKNPAGDDFDRYELKLNAKASGFWREWCDAVLFATHETHTYEANGRTKGIMSGARVLHTERCAAWDAKNRYDLPAKLPLDWASFAEAVEAQSPDDPARLRARIDRMLDQLGPERAELFDQISLAVEQAGDNAGELARIANKVAVRVAQQDEQQTEDGAS